MMSMINVVSDIEVQGYSSQHLPGFDSELLELKSLAKKSFTDGQFRAGGIGSDAKKVSAIRGDQIAWLQTDFSSEILQRILVELRQQLSEYFLCHIESFEGHFSYYAPGTSYQAHYDRSSSQNSGSQDRIFSFIIYLNEDWKKSDGGELRLLIGETPIDVEPRLGNFVVFRSDTVLHEVLETKAGRWAVSGWFRRK